MGFVLVFILFVEFLGGYGVFVIWGFCFEFRRRWGIGGGDFFFFYFDNELTFLFVIFSDGDFDDFLYFCFK